MEVSSSLDLASTEIQRNVFYGLVMFTDCVNLIYPECGRIVVERGNFNDRKIYRGVKEKEVFMIFSIISNLFSCPLTNMNPFDKLWLFNLYLPANA